MIDWSSCSAVERDPERVSGAWVFRGTRVPVTALFQNLEDGAQISDFVTWFPNVTLEQIHTVLGYIADERSVAIYEDARSLANMAVWSVELQIHRLRADETEIPDFVMQPVVDFHFLVIALARLRKAAELAAKTTDISAALKQFDETLPDLKNMRNALEHIDEYRLGEGRNKNVKANELQTVILDHDKIVWLGYEIIPVKALQASDHLFNAIRNNPPSAYLEKVKRSRL